MTEKTLTTENIKPALDALRGELAPWPVVAKKQDRLNTAQLNAANSGITSSLVAQIIANTAAIRALESAITGTGLRALVVASLPAVGTQGILYIVPVTTYDPATDADVVNYSNEYIWIVAPDAPATEGYYEQVGQTGIVINDGTLTVKANNVSLGTFTANQSGNTDINITIPTNSDYVDKTTAQTVAGVKTFSDGIVSNVTGTVTGNVTGDLTGTASRAVSDSGGNTISSTYGKLAGNQTWSGENTTTNNFNIQKSSPALRIRNTDVVITSDGQQSLSESKVSTLAFKTSNDAFVNAELINYANASFNRFRFVSRWYTSSSTSSGNGVGFDLYTDGTTKGILPTEGSLFNLGTTTYKWKTLNGISPDALSLPSSGYVEIDTTSWDLTGATSQSYTPAVHGWLYISIQNIAGNYLSMVGGRGAVSIDGTGVQSGLRAMLPVIANEAVTITVKTGSIFAARFYPMLGNV